MNKINFRIQRQDNLNEIFVEDMAGPGNGRHHYQVFKKGASDTVASPLLDIQFQCGARNEEGSISGVLDQDLLEIVRNRLQCFQKGEYATRENACALTHIEEALMWMAKRSNDRAERGVLGTMQK
ncbi:MAG: ABC transporter ATPase [Clostridia bacterium]|nr:ABC transporter ATPase [Clostridia bacterium]